MTAFTTLGSFVSLMAALALAPAWCADTSTDVEKLQRQATSIPDLLQSAANAVGYAVNRVDVQHTLQQVTVIVVNGQLNDAAAVGREHAALAIASVVEAAMAGKTEYGQVAVIRLDFVNRSGGGDEVVQSFEFFRTATNTFALHSR